MATIYGSATVNLPAEELWAKVVDVGRLSDLLEVIEESSLSGDTRSLRLTDGAQLIELIVGIDEEQRRVAYTITDSPFPLEFHASSMQVVDEGDGKSTFIWITDVKPDSMVDGLGPLIQSELDNLGRRLGG